MTILIIEGPDLAGKTFAIEKIAKHFNRGFTLKNNFKPINKQSSSQIYAQYWKINALISKQDFVILDRFFPSQAVYSYLRGIDEIEHSEIKALDRYAWVNDYLYIYLDTPLNLLMCRYEERGDAYIKIEQLKEIKERYDKFYNLTPMKKIKVDTLEEDWLEKLEAQINENRK